MMMDGKLFQDGLLIVLREISHKQDKYYQKMYNLTSSTLINSGKILKLCNGCNNPLIDYYTKYISIKNVPITVYKYCCSGIDGDNCEISYCQNCILEKSIYLCRCGAINCEKCFKKKDGKCNICYEEEFDLETDL